MTDVIITSNEVLNIIVILGILGLISTFLLKFYNVLKICDIYNIQLSVIVLAIGVISFIFIEMGALITVNQDVNSVLEYAVYLNFSRLFIIIIWFFWFAELIIYAGKTVHESVEEAERMTKRRNDRVKKHHY